MQEEIVGRGQAGGIARTTEEVGNREGKGERGREEGEECEEKDEESLHCGFLKFDGWVKLQVVGIEVLELRIKNDEDARKLYRCVEFFR